VCCDTLPPAAAVGITPMGLFADQTAVVLLDAIGNLLPSAVGIALSPIPIVAVVLMLDTPRARTNGPAFALGWIAGLLAASLLVLFVFGGADDPDSGASDGVNWLTLGLGVLFIAMARKQWRSRPRKGEASEMPKWMETIDSFTPAKALVLGVVLPAVNPKNLALAFAAAAGIAQAGLGPGDDVIAIAIFVAIASATTVGLVLVYLVAGERTAQPLAALKEFMAEHNNVIMMIILLVLGAKLIGNGLAGV
jgi:threonine/homoserine/homoserine lactone efflux protein